MASGEPTIGIRRHPEFTTTRWGVVLSAGGASSEDPRKALEQLCADYWYPLYAYVRRKGHSPEDASDLTQEFFARLLRADFAAGLAPGKGRFRSFLLTPLNHFLIDEWKKAQAAKRGSGATPLSLDALINEQGEAHYRVESPTIQSPERLFDRAWAEAVLERVLERLGSECSLRGDNRFPVLRRFLATREEAPSLALAASEMNLSIAAFKSLLHRFRQRYRELLLAEIGQTVSTEEELASEVRELMAALRNE